MVVIGAMSVTAFASSNPIDTAGIAEAFSSSISATITIVMGIIPLAGGLLALSLGIKKGLQFIKKF